MPLTESQTRYVNFYTDFAAKFNPKELVSYEESLKNYRDWYSTIMTKFDEGKKEGQEEGLEKAKIDMAIKMKRRGYDINEISIITGLSEEEINSL